MERIPWSVVVDVSAGGVLLGTVTALGPDQHIIPE